MTRREITKYLEERKDNEPSLFMSNFDNRISKGKFPRLLAKYDTHPYALMHPFITIST
jgi:hypothetical protein